MTYDSRVDTYGHIGVVRANLLKLVIELIRRAEEHDASKLESPEVEVFDEFTPKLANMEYGSEEYRQCIRDMGPALGHHYAHNRHHPEFHEDGVDGMNLIDVIEMLCDWEAASHRTKNGDLRKSLPISFERFGIGDQLAKIIGNTVEAIWGQT